MTSRPAIPSLFLIPDEAGLDYSALFAIATAYADSGLLISDQGKRLDRYEFSFPAIVCSAFAIELFLKFFLMLPQVKSEESPKKNSGHLLGELWQKVLPRYKELIAGMHLNKTGIPLPNASDRRIELFVKALENVGNSPFLEWRYTHEKVDATLMSHAAVIEVLDALGYAANFVMKEKSAPNFPVAQIPTEIPAASKQTELDGAAILKRFNSEGILLGRNSVLRRIPANVNPKQVLFLDGMRHAVEIMDVAYDRLRAELTKLALNPPIHNELPIVSANVFLDAWSFVDAVDRFRMLYKKMPGKQQRTTKTDIPTLDDATREFRNLRNVADHLAERADFVVSKNGAALGELTWLTGAQLVPNVIAWHCTLRPGTLASKPEIPTNAILGTLVWPTSSICLSAGGYEGNLSEVRAHIALRLTHLEAQLVSAFKQPNFEKIQIVNDVFTRRPVKLNES